MYKNIEETKLVNITIENGNSYHKCSSYKVYIACILLFSIILAIGIGTGIYFVYYRRHLKNMVLILFFILMQKQ